MELRVDVQWSAASVDDELKSLHARLERSGLLKSGTGIFTTQLPGLILRHREADGEHYIYVEDVARGRLAGYTVFNRLIEVNRRLDRFVRAPHSKYAVEYQRRGIATAVYEWALDQGFCLVSGARQSQSAHALWISLATRHRLEYVEVRNKSLHLLASPVDPKTRDRLQTRMVLLGKGWVVEADSLKPPTECASSISGRPLEMQ
ncbi:MULTISPECIES: N-acetyltransferase [unclassified Hydrogenophaga]|uniref:N-acetyltransferase n=1 Tax=unclassified Hydrogenophaga TaxID=2610897 RepID=UPI0019110EFD|nr:N-acetyltransferase [Hydrogenophaga sp. Root209]